MGSKESHINVVNKTESDIKSAKCSDIDHADWKGKDTPESQFTSETKIKSHKSLQRRVEMKDGYKKCPWTMRLTYENGKVDQIRAEHKEIVYAKGNIERYYTITASDIHDITVTTDSKGVQVEITDNIEHIIQLLTQAITKKINQRKYNEAENELNKALGSDRAKKSEAYRQECLRLKERVKDERKAGDLVNQAKQGKGDFEGAFNKLRQAERLTKDNARLNEIGEIREELIKKQFEEQAQKILTEAEKLENDGKYDEAFDKLSKIVTTSKETMEKIANMRKRLMIKKDNVVAQNMQGEAITLVNNSEFELGIAKCEQALSIVGDDATRKSLGKIIDDAYDKQSELLQKQANDLINQDNMVEVTRLFEKALYYAKNNTKRIDSIKKDMAAVGDKIAEQIQKQANDMINQNDLVRGREKLLYAKSLATTTSRIQSIANDIQASYKKEATKLQNEANDLVKKGKHEEADRVYDQALNVTRDQKARQAILANKMNSLKEHMELAQESGNKLAREKKFKEAEEKYHEALTLTTDGADIKSIMANRIMALDQLKEMIQKQTKEMINQNRYDELNEQLDEVMNNTSDSLVLSATLKCKSTAATKQIEFLHNKISKLEKQNELEEANKILEQALVSTSSPESIRSINADRAEIIRRQAYQLFAKVFDMQSQNYETEKEEKQAKEKIGKMLKEVQELYITAQKINPSKDTNKYLEMVSYKIKGDQYNETGANLEFEAYDLKDIAKKTGNQDDYNKVEIKLQAAIIQYEKAERSYKQGSKIDNKNIFSTSLAEVSEALKTLENDTSEIFSIKLRSNMEQTKIRAANRDIDTSKYEEKEADADVKKENYVLTI